MTTPGLEPTYPLDAALKQAGFTWDPTPTGHVRWTHFGLDLTCLRQPYMTDDQWHGAQAAALATALQRRETPREEPTKGESVAALSFSRHPMVLDLGEQIAAAARSTRARRRD